MIVVFLGPDGCGKTTISMNVELFMRESSWTVRRFEGRVGILPQLSNFVFWKRTASIKNSKKNPAYLAGMNVAINGYLKSCILVCYYGIEYFFYKFKARGELWIFARYFYDYYFQRTFRKVPVWWVHFMRFFIRKPDLIFVLKREAPMIFEQKPELTIAEIEYEYDLISKYLGKMPNVYFIDATKSIELITHEVVECIKSHRN